MDRNDFAKWMTARLEAYAQQTADFTRDINGMTDGDLIEITYVGPYFLRGLPEYLHKVAHPKHRPTIRRAIAYLEALREAQDDAMEREIKRNIAENDRCIAAIDRYLKKHGYKNV